MVPLSALGIHHLLLLFVLPFVAFFVMGMVPEGVPRFCNVELTVFCFLVDVCFYLVPPPSPLPHSNIVQCYTDFNVLCPKQISKLRKVLAVMRKFPWLVSRHMGSTAELPYFVE